MIKFIKNLINKHAADSSKRAVLLYIVAVVLTPTVYIYTTISNFPYVLGELLTFLSFLAGGAIYESIHKKDGKL